MNNEFLKFYFVYCLSKRRKMLSYLILFFYYFEPTEENDFYFIFGLRISSVFNAIDRLKRRTGCFNNPEIGTDR